MIKKSLLLFCLLLPGILLAQSQVPPLDYFSNGRGAYNLIALPYGPVAFPDAGGALWTNPAGIGIDGSSGLMLLGTTTSGGDNESSGFEEDWGWGFNLGQLGFGVEYARSRGLDANRYTMGFAGEMTEGWTTGWAYHWSDRLDRDNSWDFGTLIRPCSMLSVGAMVTEIGRPRINGMRVSPTYHLGLGVRPFGNTLTLTADATLWETANVDYGDSMDVTLGATWQPVPNIALRGGYALDSETIFAGISISSAFSTISNYSGIRNESVTNQPDMVGSTYMRFSSQWAPELNDYIFKKPTVVRYKLRGSIVEESAPFGLFYERHLTLLDLLERVRRMTNDPSIDGLVLEIENVSMGSSDRAELRMALNDFRAAGKKIVVYSEDYSSLGSYYLASVADHVIMHPAGAVMMPGIRTTMPYFKGTLEKLGIEAQFITIGKYKSAAEVFTRDGMSDAARESMTAYVETLWDVILRDVSESRGVSREKVEEWINTTIFSADDALDQGVVDALAFHDELNDEVKTIFDDKAVRSIPFAMYNARVEPPKEWTNMSSPKIAIVYATGNIVSGESHYSPFGGGHTMGSTTLARAIREARSDPRVKAIVFRIDSGGGSALASDVILREIQRTVEGTDGSEGIPVIVSMSDVAGSGGYYIACLADKIIAPETCITGSIGVLGGKFVMKGLYDKIGLAHDGVERGDHAGIWSTTRLWDEEEQDVLRHEMEVTYDRFTGFVAEGREMSQDRVKELGQGRIWSGRDAVENGLVDENGGFLYAINVAREAAGIAEGREIGYKIYPRHGGPSIGRELRMITASMLPESVRQVLKAEAYMEQLNTGEPLLLCPLEDTGMIEK